LSGGEMTEKNNNKKRKKEFMNAIKYFSFSYLNSTAITL